MGQNPSSFSKDEQRGSQPAAQNGAPKDPPTTTTTTTTTTTAASKHSLRATSSKGAEPNNAPNRDLLKSKLVQFWRGSKEPVPEADQENLVLTYSDPMLLFQQEVLPLLQDLPQMSCYKVKFILSDLNSWEKPFSSMVAGLQNFVNNLVDQSPFGLMHSAVMVGPCVFHWFNTGLVHVLPIKSTRPALAFDVGTVPTDSIRLRLTPLLNLLVKWNCSKNYSMTDNNCQKFTYELLMTLGLSPPVVASENSPLGHWMKSLRNPGMKQKFFCKDGQTTSFPTHEALDRFVRARWPNKTFETLLDPADKVDWLLLKAFDRAFWMKHLSSEKHDPFETVPCDEGCPFGNPLETESFPLKITDIGS